MSKLLTRQEFKQEADEVLEMIKEIVHQGIEEADESILHAGTAIAAVTASTTTLFEQIMLISKQRELKSNVKKPNEFN